MMRHLTLHSSFIYYSLLVFFLAFPSEFVPGADEGKEKGRLIDTIRWKDVESVAKFPKVIQVVKDESQGLVLKIARSDDDPQLTEVWTFENPKIKEKAYVLRGKVKCEGIHSAGFIEMWNHFPKPKEGAYFTRTMAETGAMGKLSGDSPWRDFELPFMISDDSFPSPSKLQLNVFLPESGTVWMSDLTLNEMPVEELQEHLSGIASSTALLTTNMTLIIVGFGIVVFGVAFGVWKYLAEREARQRELRRMQALDIGRN